MSKLIKYLSETKLKLSSQCLRPLHLVMGNEACDLDSAVSAIVYAFMLYSLQKEEKQLILPVLNIPQEDYPLKTEVSYWLKKHDIRQDHLIFRDDIDSEGLKDVELTLVDHNILSLKDQHLEPSVVFILDHHKLERLNPEKVRDGVVIEMVGSCASLVTEEILKRHSDKLENAVASLLYGTIILDTVNLSEAAKRVTKKDIEMCERLREFLSPAPDNSEIFKELTAAKSDISHLTSDQLLRKDVKVVENDGIKISISSVPMSVKNYLDRPDVSSTLHQHSQKHNFDVIVIMGIIITDGTVSRDIAVFSCSADLKTKVAQYLANAGDGILQLEPFSTSVENCVAYLQRNIGASRKVVLPFVREWLSTNPSR